MSDELPPLDDPPPDDGSGGDGPGIDYGPEADLSYIPGLDNAPGPPGEDPGLVPDYDPAQGYTPAPGGPAAAPQDPLAQLGGASPADADSPAGTAATADPDPANSFLTSLLGLSNQSPGYYVLAPDDNDAPDFSGPGPARVYRENAPILVAPTPAGIDPFTGGRADDDPFTPAGPPDDDVRPEGFYRDPATGRIEYVGPVETVDRGPDPNDPARVMARQIAGNFGNPDFQAYATPPRPMTDVDRMILTVGAVELIPLAMFTSAGTGGGAVLSTGSAAAETGVLSGAWATASQFALRGSINLYMTAPRLWNVLLEMGAGIVGGASYRGAIPGSPIDPLSGPPAQSIDQTMMQLRDEAVETTRRLVADDLSSGITTSPARFGSLADAIFKAGVKAAQEIGRLPQRLQVTPASMNQPGKYGIDVWDPLTGTGWDLTTATVRQVAEHDLRYLGAVMPDGTVLLDVLPLVYWR